MIQTPARPVPACDRQAGNALQPKLPSMEQLAIRPDDPLAADVTILLSAHLAFARSHGPPEDVHAMDGEELADPGTTFYSARAGGIVVAVGAIKRLDNEHAELKSIHTAEQARGRGVGRAMVAHLIQQARSMGFRRLSLETGTMDAFAPSRALYSGLGFRVCEPFLPYRASSNSVFMTLDLASGSP